MNMELIRFAQPAEQAEQQREGSPAAQDDRDGRVQRWRHDLGEFLERALSSNYCALPDSDPLNRYLNELYQRLLSDDERKTHLARICSAWNSVNACALPNNRVLVAQYTLEFCESEEELLYVLGHELNHIRQKHFIPPRAKGMLSEIGSSRAKEWESDIMSSLMLEKLGLNPYGGILFNRRLMDYEKSKDRNTDPAHGRTIDRLLNLMYVSKLIDQSSLSCLTTPIPAEIKKRTRSNAVPALDVLLAQDIRASSNRMVLASGADLHGALLALGELYPFYEHSRKMAKDSKPFDNGYELHKDNQRVLLKLDDSVRKHIRDHGFAEIEAALLAGAAETFCANIDLFSDAAAAENSIGTRFLDQLTMPRDVDRLLRVLTPETFRRMKLAALYDNQAEQFVQGVATNLLEQSAFKKGNGIDIDKYAAAGAGLIGALQDLMPEDPHLGSRLWAAHYAAGLLEFEPDDKGLRAYAAAFAEHMSTADVARATRTTSEEHYTALFKGAQGISRAKGERAKLERLLDKIIALGTPPEFDANWSKIKKSRKELQKQLGEDFVAPEHEQPEKHIRNRRAYNSLRKRFKRESGELLSEIATILEQESPRQFVHLLRDYVSRLPDELEHIDTYDPAFRLKVEAKREQLLEKTHGLSSVIADYWRTRVRGPQRHIEALRSARAIYSREGYQLASLRWLLERIPRKDSTPPLFTQITDTLFNDASVTQAYLETITPITEVEYLDIELEDLRQYALEKTLKHSSKKNLLSDFRQLLMQHTRIDTFSDDSQYRNEAFLKRVLGKHRIRLDNKDDLELLHYLSLYHPHDTSATRMQNAVLENLLRLPFDEAYEFVFERAAKFKLATVKPLERLVEEKATTVEHLRKLKGRTHTLLDIQRQGSADLGTIVGLELLTDLTSGKLGMDSLLAIMQTHTTDLPLKKVLLETVAGDYLLNEGDQLLSTLYTLDVKHKYALIRNLFCGENGILMSRARKGALVTGMTDALIEPARSEDDSRAYRIVEDVLDALVLNANPEHAYFVLAPLLLDKILIPPQKPHSWRDVALHSAIEQENLPIVDKGDEEHEAKLLFEHCKGKDATKQFANYATELFNNENARASTEPHTKFIDDDEIASEDEECREHDEFISDNLEEFLDTAARVRNKARKFLKKGSPQYNPHKDVGVTFDKDLEKMIAKAVGRERKREMHKMPIVEFIVETARTLGSPGTRFLQLFGQYADLPQDYLAKFSKVYDGLRGQSKLAAYFLLERESPQLLEDIAHISPSVGGGSLMTVYGITRKSDGNKYALKVLNPNAQYFTDLAFDVLRETFDQLADGDRRYRLALPILDDIKQWITEDISFIGFLEKDKEFHGQNNGFTQQGHAYAMLVPRSYAPESKYYKLEDFIEGTNLTDLATLRRKGHDLKQIVSLIAKNYLTQLQNGRAHSDVHPGNFRVTDDRKVAILDRNYFLEFNDDDRTFFGNAMLHRDSPAGLSRAVCTYLATVPENQDKNVAAFETPLANHLNEQAQLNGGTSHTDKLLTTMRYIKQNNYHFPLKTTLLIKNMFALERFARDAGFENGLSDALSYQPM